MARYPTSEQQGIIAAQNAMHKLFQSLFVAGRWSIGTNERDTRLVIELDKEAADSFTAAMERVRDRANRPS